MLPPQDAATRTAQATTIVRDRATGVRIDGLPPG
jgi:hypothetical protein